MINENAGYFQMHRWIMDADFFKKRLKELPVEPTTAEEKLEIAEAKLRIAEEKLAVIDLFRKARYDAGEWKFKGHNVSVQRGDVVTAKSALAQQWGWKIKSGWDAKRVSRFLEDLEEEGWIKVNSTLKSHTIISILIYVPVPEPAKEFVPEPAKNPPKNKGGEKPGNTGDSDKKEGEPAKESAIDSAKNLPISNKDNKSNKKDNDDLIDDDYSSSKCKKDDDIDLKEKIINYFKEQYHLKTGATLFINKDRDFETIDILIRAADADFSKIEKIINVFFKDKWVIEKSAYNLGALCSSNNLNRFLLKANQSQADEENNERIKQLNLSQGKTEMGFKFYF